jgi:hypothetical protein
VWFDRLTTNGKLFNGRLYSSKKLIWQKAIPFIFALQHFLTVFSAVGIARFFSLQTTHLGFILGSFLASHQVTSINRFPGVRPGRRPMPSGSMITTTPAATRTNPPELGMSLVGDSIVDVQQQEQDAGYD